MVKHYKGRYFILISKQKEKNFYIFFAPIFIRGNELHGTRATADGVQLLGAVILRGGRRSSSVAGRVGSIQAPPVAPRVAFDVCRV